MRLDLWLVKHALARSRSQAQELIAQGFVELNDGQSVRKATKPSLPVTNAIQVRVLPNAFQEFVSRGGVKLQSAIEKTGIDVRGLTALDVGVSTGGFSDYLLQSGARRVVGVDVNVDQVDPKVRAHPPFVLGPPVNARQLPHAELLALNEEEPFDLIVVDVSFISLTLVLPQLPPLLGPQSEILALVKPQFEVGPRGLNSQGIVRDPGLHLAVERRVMEACRDHGLEPLDYFPCAIVGGDGNQELFLRLQALRSDEWEEVGLEPGNRLSPAPR
jgi:23S rRNA (cytidine1920-2'-O)/16S rRNA (cytidine1409-2'-O)-methyltransferase